MGRAFSTNGEKRYVYTLLMGKPDGKRPLGGLGGWIIFRWILER
jgi:hypothetical protein